MRISSPPRTNRGFSLVELSIVLVILGLLVGGVLSGQSLIRAAEIRSVSSDISRYNAAIYTFRDKYMALPGDMANAEKFWGGSSASANCTASSNGSACNGNGDGVLTAGDTAQAAGATAEIFQMWLQLTKAGLIEGTYTGRSNPGGSTSQRSALPGTNVPASRLSRGGYSVEYWGDRSGDNVTWDGSYGNAYIFGGAASGCCPTELAILKPEDAWNIDKKLDDGKPASGFVSTFWRRSYTLTQPGAYHCTTTNSESTSEYDFQETAVSCNLMIKTGF